MTRRIPFSEREGFVEAPLLQTDSLSDKLRSKLWNCFFGFHKKLSELTSTVRPDSDSEPARCVRAYWNNLGWNRDELPMYFTETLREFKDFFFKSHWYEVYDFLDFVLEVLQKPESIAFAHLMNKALVDENSGYRVIDSKILKITDENELETIKESLDMTKDFSGAREHLKRAASLLSNRGDPDYRNSVKESISAVESICMTITEDDSASLGQALNQIGIEDIHPALNQAFKKLYGYTSDKGGVRHALLEDSTVDFAEAKFMLVACSAFVNYLILKMQKK